MDITEPTKTHSIDPAALAIASVAAIVSVTVADGPYNLLSVPIGLSILFVLYAHDAHPRRTVREALPVAAVTAFGAMLVLGFPLERLFTFCARNTRCLGRCGETFLGMKVCFKPEYRDPFDSTVPHEMLVAVWAAAFAASIFIDRRRTTLSDRALAPTAPEEFLMPNETQEAAEPAATPTTEVLLTEYQAAQDSAQHHDTLVWSVTSVMWGGSLVLMGLILTTPQATSIRPSITIASVLGVALTLCAWRFAWQFNALKRQKYIRCKEIEEILHMHHHTKVCWPVGNQRLLYGILMLSFVAAWVLLIWRTWQ